MPLLNLSTRLIVACLLAGLLGNLNIPTRTNAQDKKADATAGEKKEADDKSADESAKEKEEKKDPYAVPEEGDAATYFAFIASVKRLPRKSIVVAVKQVDAVATACEKIRALEDAKEEQVVKAIKEQLSALRFKSRFKPKAMADIENLIDEITKDERPAIAKIAKAEELTQRASAVRTASKEEQEQLIKDVLEHVTQDKFDVAGYSLVSGIARSIGYSDTPEIAAQLYEKMHVLMKESDDERLQSRADSALGAARRLRLPGNFMEVMGTTADGEEFDWTAYRGKIVLVDFWASWCGPCRAEVPRMKAALKEYGERGFAIVGVNLDKTKKAYDGYVKREEISWVSIMSDKEEERGWNNPLAKHYGISGIPTAILVDKEGKVVSLRARGPELERLLDEMIGEEDAGDKAEKPAAESE